MSETEEVGVEPGQVYEDSIYGAKLEVLYSDEEVVLVKEVDVEHHHVYSREQFEVSAETTLFNQENRFTLANDGI